MGHACLGNHPASVCGGGGGGARAPLPCDSLSPLPITRSSAEIDAHPPLPAAGAPSPRTSIPSAPRKTGPGNCAGIPGAAGPPRGGTPRTPCRAARGAAGGLGGFKGNVGSPAAGRQSSHAKRLTRPTPLRVRTQEVAAEPRASGQALARRGRSVPGRRWQGSRIWGSPSPIPDGRRRGVGSSLHVLNLHPKLQQAVGEEEKELAGQGWHLRERVGTPAPCTSRGQGRHSLSLVWAGECCRRKGNA